METRELARIDLNLLIALQVLLEERNVSRAAERLFIKETISSTLYVKQPSYPFEP